jgi:hypothetical protein
MTTNPSNSPPRTADRTAPCTGGPPRRNAAIRPDAPVPRFGSVHMLLWIACTGVYLAANRDLYADELSPLAVLETIGQVLPRGAAWAGLAIFIRRIWQRAPWPIEPGLWLAAIAGMWLALEVVMIQFRSAQHFESPVAVHGAFVCLLLVLPTLAQGLTIDWKLFFSFLVVVFAWPLLVALVEADSTVYSAWIYRSGDMVLGARFYLAAAALAAVVCRDLARSVRHGWLHWAGLVDVVLVVLSTSLVRLDD